MRTGSMRKSVRAAVVGVIVAGVVAFGASSAPASTSEPTRLTAKAGTEQGKFGTSVWIEGNTAVVGAPDEDGMGAAYVFTRRGTVWTEDVKLVAPVRAEGGKFGYDVGLSGDTIVVGAPNADQTPLPDAGAAHVFARTRDGWAHQAKLSASDGTRNDAFGFGVAIDGDTIVIGANGGVNAPSLSPGAAYVFTRVDNVWSEQAKLTAADGAAADNFGYTVAVSGDTALVGVPSDDVGVAIDQGSARVFTRNGTTWTEQATLTAPDGSPLDQFGELTAISGDTVVAGAYFDVVGANPAQGSAHVFTRAGETWTHDAKLTAPDGGPGDSFGRSVAVTDEFVVVGAHFDDRPLVGPDAGGNPTGSLYVFERDSGRWAEPTRLTAEGSGLLGVSVAVSGHTVIGGANFTTVDGRKAQGAAYVFDLRPRPTGVGAAEAVPLAARSGSAIEVAGAQSELGQTLPVTGSDTRAPTVAALTALAIGWPLVLSARAASR